MAEGWALSSDISLVRCLNEARKGFFAMHPFLRRFREIGGLGLVGLIKVVGYKGSKGPLLRSSSRCGVSEGQWRVADHGCSFGRA